MHMSAFRDKADAQARGASKITFAHQGALNFVTFGQTTKIGVSCNIVTARQ